MYVTYLNFVFFLKYEYMYICTYVSKYVCKCLSFYIRGIKIFTTLYCNNTKRNLLSFS